MKVRNEKYAKEMDFQFSLYVSITAAVTEKQQLRILLTHFTSGDMCRIYFMEI
jgi:hypothetical protein